MALVRLGFFFRAFCIFVLAATFVHPKCWAQGDESAFVPLNIGSMAIPVSTERTKGDPVILGIDFYKAIRNDSHTSGTESYAFTPYFTFLRTPKGKAYATFNEPDGSKTIRLRLAVYDEALKQSAANWLSAKTGLSISTQDVQVLPLWQLRISELNSGRSITLPERTINPSVRLGLQPVQDIFFRHLLEAESTALQKAIDDGDVSFSFEYSYKKGQTTIASYSLKYSDVAQTNVFQQLTGGGGAGLVSRDGAVRVASAIALTLEIWSYVEDDSTKMAVQNDLTDLLLNKLHFKEAIDYTRAENLKTLNSLSVDPKGTDFEADRISKTHDVIASSHDFSELNKHLREGGGAIGYGSINANANFKSNDEVNQAIKDTFSRDWKGNNWSSIPKTINVYQLNSTDFQGSALIRQVSVKPTFGMQSYSVAVSQSFPLAAELVASMKAASNEGFLLVPIGTIIAYAGKAIPQGWHLCDGTLIDLDKKPDFAALFRVIGYSYGGTGKKFQVPDLQGRVPVGAGIGIGLPVVDVGKSFGKSTHQLAASELPDHKHFPHYHTWLFAGGGANLVVGNGNYNSAFRPANDPDHYPGIPTEGTRPDKASGYITSDNGATKVDPNTVSTGVAFPLQPPSLGVNFIIRYR